ncbi:MAG: hypothetical protein EAX91_12800 [Candidatus Lokiarchaeota archaeon]|nr:hypothetical protein [Candidatus Lokiarchaeota archaeon]
MKTPEGYVDGILVKGKVIRNALLTYIDGNCLLSKFFDPDLIEFGGLEFWLNDEYWGDYENYLNNEYVDIYTVFSFTESDEHLSLGTLVHLTDPSTRSDNLHYKLTRLEPHFQSHLNLGIKRSSTEETGKIICDPFAKRDSSIVYGEEFTKEVFMRIFYELFDPYTQFYTQRTQTLAMKFLSYLNGIPHGTNFEEFSLGPGLAEVNTALKKLGFTEAELQSLIWKKVDPKTGILVFNYEQTNKEWLKLIYDKITGYPHNDGSIYARERDKLLNLGKPKYHKLDDASITRNRKECTVEEARMGVEIFESAKVIFGHFTIRLMFTNMIDYYGNAGSFGIKILNRPSLEPRGKAKDLPLEERQYMRDFLFKIGLIPSTFQYDRPVQRLVSYTSKNDMISTITFLFGFFHLESHLYLEIENMANVKTDDNMLSLPLGPLVSLTASGGFSGENIRSLSREIGIYLESTYERYRFDNLNPTDVSILGRNFLNDQSGTLDFIAKKIKTQIIDGHYYMDKTKNKWLANQLIEHARLGLISERAGSKTAGYLRLQIESFMDNDKAESKQNSFILEFNYLMPKSRQPFKLEIKQSELVDYGIVAWGKRALLESDEYSTYRAKLLLQNSHNIRKYLTGLIDVLGDGKKIRIFPLFDGGDINTGGELFRNAEDYSFQLLPDGETYLDIDLNNDNDLFKLQHVINLLYTGKFTFVVKKLTGTWNDGEMIFAFNREGFLEPNEIYSQSMIISKYSTIFRGDSETWQKLWIYPKAWSSDTRAQNSDINSYFHYIDNPKRDITQINRFIKEYMERMEILFPGYRLIMKKYLFYNINP